MPFWGTLGEIYWYCLTIEDIKEWPFKSGITSQGAGKNKIAMRVCDELGGEIVSADSVQVYRQLEIGANKPSREERKRVPHHLVDLVDTHADFTAGAWCREGDPNQPCLVYEVESVGADSIYQW